MKDPSVAKERYGSNLTKVVLSLLGAVGLLLFILFIAPSSESRNTLIFGLSPVRAIIASLFLLLLAVTFWGLYLSIIQSKERHRLLTARVNAYLSRHLSFTLVLLYGITIISAYLMLLSLPPIPTSLTFLESIRVRLLPFVVWLFLAGCGSIILIRLRYSTELHDSDLVRKLDGIFIAAGIFLITFFLYEHIAAWIGWVNKSRYSYWDSLAEQFLNGQLYLKHPPQTHDLTYYNGHWYVPNPPVPALVMIPFAFFFDADEIQTGDISILFSAINVVLVYLILMELKARRWINITVLGGLCLIALLAFGTPHLWVGINGRMWFVSQILTVSFLAFGTLAAIKEWSPWLVGVCIGLAVGTRPNGLMSWPFMFGIAMQILYDRQGKLNLNQALSWAMKSSIPIALAIGGLLLYNFARFNDFMDFGYTNINGDPVIVESAQKYGLFSLRYIPYNLKVMFAYLPTIQWGSRWPILPSGAGMSLFLTTPALIYLFHRYEQKIWVWGAWLAIVFNFLLLALYHNAGKDQFGYRYILDMIVPILSMLALAIGKKIPWHFLLLLALSIGINLYGAYWFMNY